MHVKFQRRVSESGKKRGGIVFGSALLLVLLAIYEPFDQGRALTASVRIYHVEKLPLRPHQIADSGKVAGTTDKHQAAVWTRTSGLHQAGSLPGFATSEGVAINNLGEMVGYSWNREYTKVKAFLYQKNKLIALSGEQSKAHSITDSTEIVGESLVSGKPSTRAVVWRNGTLEELMLCSGGNATGINSRGQVIGSYYDDEGLYHAFLCNSDHTLQPLGPSQVFSNAVALNKSGHVVVQRFGAGVYLWIDGNAIRLTLSSKFQCSPHAINDSDVVVGEFGPSSDKARAFIWEKTQGFRDLNSLLRESSGWKLKVASSINNKGEIVGWGDHDGEEDVGFLLTPE